jgi:trans-aconitate methyltransferase
MCAMKWNADLYDDKHAFVSQYGQGVLDLLDVKPGERILDLGCGTGDLAKQIMEHGADVIGIDASPEMIGQAKQKYPDLNFSVADGTDFHFDEPFDAVFSNAALHWIHDQDKLIECVYRSLKPGGRFVGEFGGKGNMQHMIAAAAIVLKAHGYDRLAQAGPWYFPSVGEYASKLEMHGFRVTFAAHFDRWTLLEDGSEGVGKWIAMFGSQFLEGIPGGLKGEIINEITNLLDPYYNQDGKWYADYKRLRFVAVKE